jgi:uncharacterized protein with von Willebrand factor type A (vWA) domain
VSRYRYGPWRGGGDPLEPPYDVAAAVDRLGERVLAGQSPREAMRELMRGGLTDRRGLDALREQVRRRRDELRRGDLSGILQQAQTLLDEALATERAALAADPHDAARDREATLDRLPDSLPQAVRELADYDWTSPQARELYEQIRAMVREEVLRQQVRGRPTGSASGTASGGASDASSTAASTAAAMKDLLADLNALLAAHARGEDTTEQFEQFMQRHGEAFPEGPRSTDELIDLLARRAAAAERLLRSLDPEQREALRDLIAQALADDLDLAAQLSALRDNLRTLRPGLDWSSRQRMAGGEPLGYTEATDALDELARLDDLLDQLGQRYPGATLDDIDVEALADVLGPAAVTDVEALRRLERELADQGWVTGTRQDLQLSAKAVRRLGQTALRRVLDQIRAGRGGPHEQHRAGAAGEPTGAWRGWEFGDEQPLDVVRTVQQALVRTAAEPRQAGAVGLEVSDFAVLETEARTSAAVALLVDLSFSMVSEGRWGPMKQTALALQHLVSTRFRQDALEIIGFDRWARPLGAVDLAAVEPSYVPGTNLQHALLLAHRFLRRHPNAQPIVVVVTDGEPTAHLDSDGEAVFSWPPMAETVRRTVAEVDDLTRLGAVLTIVMLGEDAGLERFVRAIARRNGGRVLTPSLDRLGEYVVADYLHARRGRR